MSLVPLETLQTLCKARQSVQAALERHTASHPANAEDLTCLRALAETYAKQTDALIARLKTDRCATVGQIGEAEHLRAFFRAAAGHLTALIGAGPG